MTETKTYTRPRLSAFWKYWDFLNWRYTHAKTLSTYQDQDQDRPRIIKIGQWSSRSEETVKISKTFETTWHALVENLGQTCGESRLRLRDHVKTSLSLGHNNFSLAKTFSTVETYYQKSLGLNLDRSWLSRPLCLSRKASDAKVKWSDNFLNIFHWSRAQPPSQNLAGLKRFFPNWTLVRLIWKHIYMQVTLEGLHPIVKFEKGKNRKTEKREFFFSSPPTRAHGGLRFCFHWTRLSCRTKKWFRLMFIDQSTILSTFRRSICHRCSTIGQFVSSQWNGFRRNGFGGKKV